MQEATPTISLGKVSSPLLLDIKAKYTAVHGNKAAIGLYSKYDWSRVEYVFSLLNSGMRVLDVGVGAGQLFNMLQESEKYIEVHGIDIRTHSKFLDFSETGYLKEMDIVDLKYPDNYFDTVVCMEVLEHIPLDAFKIGLKEIRRVCRNQLIMSVPWQEPLPLPKFHKLRFEEKEIDMYFAADAKFTLLDKPNVPWLLIEECVNS